MSKRDEAAVALRRIILKATGGNGEVWLRTAHTAEVVNLFIDAAKEELRAEMLANVLSPAEMGKAEGGVME